MNNNVKKQRSTLGFVLVFYFIIVLQTFTFATSYEKANVVIGPNSTDRDQLYVDGKNFALDSLKNIMDGKDFLLTLMYVSDYRKGDKDAELRLREVIGKYNLQDVDQIINYVIQDNTVKLLAIFNINHIDNQLTYVPINGLTTISVNDFTMLGDTISVADANAMWLKIINFIPKEFADDISSLRIDYNKVEDNIVTINSINDDLKKWELTLDVSLFSEEKVLELYKNLIYATTFYYALRDDQVDNLSNNKDTYTYQEKKYKENSYINMFYKKFWKGRRKEVNTDQYDLYKNEFLDRKASRTVYDDMAVSYYSYVTNGIMRRYLGFRADKNNFFDDYPVFKDMAKIFRIKLGIRMS